MRLNPKMTKHMAVSRSCTYTPGYNDFTHGAELEKVQSLHILGVIYDS